MAFALFSRCKARISCSCSSVQIVAYERWYARCHSKQMIVNSKHWRIALFRSLLVRKSTRKFMDKNICC